MKEQKKKDRTEAKSMPARRVPGLSTAKLSAKTKSWCPESPKGKDKSRQPKVGREAAKAMNHEGTGFGTRSKDDNGLVARLQAKVEEKGKGGSRNTRRVFRQFDMDSDGSISVKDFKTGLDVLGMTYTDKEFKDLIKTVDKAENGEVDYSEFSNKLMTFNRSSDAVATVKNRERRAQESSSALVHKGTSFDEPKNNMLAVVADRLGQNKSTMRTVFRDFDKDRSGLGWQKHGRALIKNVVSFVVLAKKQLYFCLELEVLFLPTQAAARWTLRSSAKGSRGWV